MKEDELVLYVNKKKTILGLIASFVMFMFSIFFSFALIYGYQKGTLWKLDPTRILMLLLMPFCGVLFGSAFLFQVFRFFDKKAILVINKDYIYDGSSWFSFGKTYWENIEQIEVIGVQGQRQLSVSLKHLPDKVNLIHKKVRLINQKLGFSPYNIAEINLGVNLDMVVEYIKMYAPDSVKLNI